MQFDISNMGLTLVVPWLLPDDVHDESSQLRASMEKIYKEKVGENSVLFLWVWFADPLYFWCLDNNDALLLGTTTNTN